MIRRLAVLCILAFLAMGAGEYRKLGNTAKLQAALDITSAADTAQVVKIHAYEALDSFTYSCSIYYATAYADSIVSWTSPNQRMRLLVEGTDVDTTQTLNCSVAFAAHTLGFELAIEDAEADTSVTALVDTLVSLFNNTAALKDSVLAQDSGTYLVLVSKFGEQNIGTWSLILSPAAGDTLDTASINPTTLAMVTDSMVAKINAETAISTILTAAALAGDSTYSLTSDDPGLPITIVVIDSAQDTSLTQANVASSSTDSGTVELGKTEGFKTLHSVIILNPAITEGYGGIGNADSARLWLYSYVNNPVNRVLLDSGCYAALPCTLTSVIHSNVGDTALRSFLDFKWWIIDTASDTTATFYCPMHWDITLK